MGVAAAAVGVGVVGLYQGYEAGKRADSALGAQEAQARTQAEIAGQQLDLSTEQWELYRDNIYPLEQEAQQLGLDYQKLSMEQYEDYYKPLGDQFAKDAMEGVEAQPERAARDARLSVDQQFDTEEGMIQRNLERRGVRPGAGNYSGAADTGLNRAATKAFAVNRAVEGERDRVEDVDFNRKAVALGRSPNAPGGGSPGVTAATSAYNLAGGARTANAAGNQFGSVANTYGNAAGGIASGGIQLGMQAYDLYNKYSTPASTVPTYGNTPAAPTNFQAPVTTNVDTGFSPTAFADGGPVPDMSLKRGYANGGMVGYNDGGQVNGPEGVDKVPAYIEGDNGERYPAKLTKNEFVIPADVVAAVGTDTLDDIIESARSRKMKNAQSPNGLTRSAA